VERLKQKIQEEGIILSEQVLSLDSVLNHQIDPQLIMEMGKEFAARFASVGATRIVTVESSGIAIAFATAFHLDLPLIFARKKKTRVMDEDLLVERVPSFTKGFVTDLVLSRKMVAPNDRILVIDDIMANGEGLKALLRMLGQTGSEVVGVGVAIEKTFQRGGADLRDSGLRVESLVKIHSLADHTIHME
jgi:xanthine phosphoribosyltransferase